MISTPGAPSHPAPRIAAAACALLLAVIAPAPEASAEPPPSLVLALRHTGNGSVTDYRITVGPDMARLERVGETRPPSPVNLIHRKTGALTIIRPHNRLVTTLPGTAFDAPKAGEGGPGAPAGIGAQPAPPGTPAPAVQGVTVPPGVPVRIGPDPSLLPGGESIPGGMSVPRMPDMPPLPGRPEGPPAPGVGSGFAPGGGLGPGIPPSTLPAGFPGVAPGFMPGGFPGETSRELTPREETRDLHGYSCRRHTLGLGPDLELELWLSDARDFPPFHLLAWDGPPRFGPRDPRMSWPHALRAAGKFPLLAVLLHVEPVRPMPPAAGQAEAPPPLPQKREMERWEIVSITPATPDPALFAVPEGYLHTDQP